MVPNAESRMVAVPLVSLGRCVGVDTDPELPTVARALKPALAEARLARCLPWATTTVLRSIRVVAYTPRRRCVIEYEIERPSPTGRQTMVVFGTVRAKRFGKSGYRQLRALWEAGFDDESPDGISIPEPIGNVPAFQMWLQKKAQGRMATSLLSGSDSGRVACRIADAVQKLHTAGVATDRRHTMADELRNLRRRLIRAAVAAPNLLPRIGRLLEACERVAAMVPEPTPCGSHSDLHPDQVLLTDQRLFLLDLDLYCMADPALDIGNFMGHVTELSVRLHGDADALAPVEHALENRFVSLAGERLRWPVRVYAALTVARHIYSNARPPGRRRVVPALLTAAEERVQEIAAEGGHA
jgi:hypothetical protein